MKKPSILMMLLVSITFTISSAFGQAPFAIERGTNVSHWLSQSSKRGAARETYFTRSDVAFIAEQGFDHIRIPIDEEQMWDKQGNQESAAFELLHNALKWCDEFGLKAIVDLHILRSHHFNRGEKPLWTDPKEQERFFQCWRELSDHLVDYPIEQVAYELMNEPVADDPEDWNKLVAKCLAVVREKEPQRKIIIGSNRWQSVDTFETLRLPEGDPNLIVSFHFYLPFPITHYQASWTPIADYRGPVNYPGMIVPEDALAALEEPLRSVLAGMNGVYTKDSLEALILKPIVFARERGLQVYCGEWGSYPTIDQAMRLRWYGDVRSILEKHHVSWTTWDYKGGFGIRDGKTGEAYPDLIGVLTK